MVALLVFACLGKRLILLHPVRKRTEITLIISPFQTAEVDHLSGGHESKAWDYQSPDPCGTSRLVDLTSPPGIQLPSLRSIIRCSHSIFSSKID